MRVDTIVVGCFQVNCYIVSSIAKNAIIIDPGDDYSRIAKFLDKEGVTSKMIVHTHGHIDHIGADNEFYLPVYVHRLDIPLLRDSEKNLSSFLSVPFEVTEAKVKVLEDLDVVTLDEINLKVIHTPGHTPGGICLKADKFIFTGDTLFMGSVGRTDFAGASHEVLLSSIKKRLLDLSDDMIIYPGHGPSSTIGREKKKNQFLR